MSHIPTRISAKDDPGHIRIEWEDGETTCYTAAQLRRLCPCAQCVSELTGQRLLDPSTIAEDLTQTGVELVGLYAITVRFSDGHSTGIFPFQMLRENDPAASHEAG